ncbi:group II intron reverse transcriptase/maturase [Nocardia uniformis]|uniref:Group II intron reverse transcriptase/maturase n=1 Tax=Nocardia uniformis TaxID=53432 RepID=A0A849CDA1_9NOCA|nr:group II intron reverse transcriptase/maturase [Nocardia uniformis]NNH73099.1 group II intron reverse transcriptase/maturase [Nocardia uniformis]
MNTDASVIDLPQVERRVPQIQAKLHRWAGDDPHRRFDDLYNLVCDPTFLAVAWERVRNNRGARSAGVDRQTVRYIEDEIGVEVFLQKLRADVKSRSFTPLPAREQMIPKANGKLRRLGIPTVRDRVVQAALKLVLEPIFEADFLPCSYGFRPNRRAHDAIAEIRHFAGHSYEWAVEGDIKACFDEISHPALMTLVGKRIGDKRVLALVKAFLKAGILAASGALGFSDAGTPQGGVLSPLLANIALSVLDEHMTGKAETPRERERRRKHGLANYRIIRYADDFVILVIGTRADAQALLPELAEVLSTVGLRLSEEKTLITHIDEGMDFLGWRIQRHRQKGSSKHINRTLAIVLRLLNTTLRGWAEYFRYGVSHATFSYLTNHAWLRVGKWMRRKHSGLSWKELRRLYGPSRLRTQDGITLIDLNSVSTKRYRYRGAKIPTPWATAA